MDPKDFLRYPISTLRRWALSNRRLLLVGGCWTLAVGFIIISLVTLLKSLGIL